MWTINYARLFPIGLIPRHHLTRLQKRHVENQAASLMRKLTLERFHLFEGRAAIPIWQVHLSSKAHTAYILLPLRVLLVHTDDDYHLQNCLNELLFFNQVISIFHLSIFHLKGICFVLSSALGAIFFNPLYTPWSRHAYFPS